LPPRTTIEGMNSPVKIGVVGCGLAFEFPYWQRLHRLHCHGLVQVTWACDLDETKRSLAQRLDIPRFTSDYNTLVSAPDVDLVLILTSMRAHGPVAQAALQNGKHVLVEKPMAVTLDQAAGLVQLAADSDRYLMCAPHVILSPTFQAIWRHVQAGTIGKVQSARAIYGEPGPEWASWFYQTDAGALFDLGVYNLTSLTGLLGPARRVTALMGAAIPHRIVNGQIWSVEEDDNTHLLLDFGEAVFAVVTTGFTLAQYRCPALELYGTRGTLQMQGEDWDPNGYEMWLNETDSWHVHRETQPDWPWTDGLRHLVECIRGQQPPLIQPEHAFHVLEIMLKAKESARSGKVQTISSTCPPLAIRAAEPAQQTGA
jgi:predicted dehydrogenase